MRDRLRRFARARHHPAHYAPESSLTAAYRRRRSTGLIPCPKRDPWRLLLVGSGHSRFADLITTNPDGGASDAIRNPAPKKPLPTAASLALR